jgi:hypothetical protein
MTLQPYVSFPYESPIWEEYAHLVTNSFNTKSPYFPFIGELLDISHQAINLVVRSEKIKEAIEQGLHKKYGYPSHVFHMKASEGKVAEFQYQELPKGEVDSMVLNYLQTRYISYTDHNYKLINSPLGGGVW